MWDTALILETVIHNRERSDSLNSSEALITKLFKRYSRLIEDYKTIYLKDNLEFSKIQSDTNNQRVFVTFYYSEIKSPKEWLNNGILILNSYDSGKTWKVFDITIR